VDFTKNFPIWSVYIWPVNWIQDAYTYFNVKLLFGMVSGTSGIWTDEASGMIDSNLFSIVVSFGMIVGISGGIAFGVGV